MDRRNRELWEAGEAIRIKQQRDAAAAAAMRHRHHRALMDDLRVQQTAREQNAKLQADFGHRSKPQSGRLGSAGGFIGGGTAASNGLVRLVAVLAAAFLGWKAMLAVPVDGYSGLQALLAGVMVAFLVYKLVMSGLIGGIIAGVFELVAGLVGAVVKLVVVVGIGAIILYVVGHMGH